MVNWQGGVSSACIFRGLEFARRYSLIASCHHLISLSPMNSVMLHTLDRERRRGSERSASGVDIISKEHERAIFAEFVPERLGRCLRFSLQDYVQFCAPCGLKFPFSVRSSGGRGFESRIRIEGVDAGGQNSKLLVLLAASRRPPLGEKKSSYRSDRSIRLEKAVARSVEAENDPRRDQLIGISKKRTRISHR